MKQILTYWERGPLDTFETGRAQLLDLIEELAQKMREDTPPRLVMDGETALLDDVAALRPDLQALLVVYNATGYLDLGPWYIQPQALLASGEALVRNLLAARASAEHYYGMTLADVAYSPASNGFPAQLPQILHGFGIETLIIKHGTQKQHFCWQAPDGSRKRVLNLCQPLSIQGREVMTQPYGDGTHDEAIRLSALEAAPDQPALPVIEGELFAQEGQQAHHYLFPGMLSNRMYLKQANARLQAQLTYQIEPLLAIASTHGKLHARENLCALLDHSWRMLLLNQRFVGGTGSDEAHAEQEARALQIADVNRHITHRALDALQRRQGHTVAEQTYVVVWNPHNWPVQQVVNLALQLPDGAVPVRLVDAQSREIPFVWADKTLTFPASAPPVGYTTYTLYTDSQPAEGTDVERAPGTSISNTLGDQTLSIVGDHIVWQHTEPAIVQNGKLIRESTVIEQSADLLRFFDGGDAGDTFNYSPPAEDVIVQASLLTAVKVERSRVYERLIFQHRLRVAPSLNADRARVRGVKSLDLMTTATLYHHVPGIHFHTSFENAVNDHRLRAHISTGLRSQNIRAGSAFGITRHEIANSPFVAPTGPQLEAPVTTHPLQNICVVDNGSEALALLVRDLPEYEAISENGQITLALTLLRAVGWRNRADLRSRTESLGPQIATPGAQCHRQFEADYALMPVPPADPAALLRAGEVYAAPLQVYQYQERPPLSTHSYLTVEGEGLVLTALKPPQKGSGWIVRLLNPTTSPVTATVRPAAGLKTAQMVNMAEETQTSLPVENGSIKVTLAPHKIITLRLNF